MAFYLTATYITVACESFIHRLQDVKYKKSLKPHTVTCQYDGDIFTVE